MIKLTNLSMEAVFLFEQNKNSELYILGRPYSSMSQTYKLIIIPPSDQTYWYCMMKNDVYQDANIESYTKRFIRLR